VFDTKIVDFLVKVGMEKDGGLSTLFYGEACKVMPGVLSNSTCAINVVVKLV
jgi:hypothetical protein